MAVRTGKGHLVETGAASCVAGYPEWLPAVSAANLLLGGWVKSGVGNLRRVDIKFICLSQVSGIERKIPNPADQYDIEKGSESIHEACGLGWSMARPRRIDMTVGWRLSVHFRRCLVILHAEGCRRFDADSASASTISYSCMGPVFFVEHLSDGNTETESRPLFWLDSRN